MSSVKLNNRKISRFLLLLPVLTMIAIVLFFGLRPMGGSDLNNVHWMPDKKNLNFQEPGIAYLDDLRIFADEQQIDEWTIQIAVAPENRHKLGFRTILMLHNGDDQDQFAIWQWGDAVIVMNGDDYEYARKLPRISETDALRTGTTSFITVTSTPQETRLFLNGTLAKEMNNWHATLPNSRKKLQLILGNSVYGKHSWEGGIYGLALYRTALSQERVQRDYDKWLQKKIVAPGLMDELLLLYTFNEDQGRLVPDRIGNNPPLQLPVRQVVLKKTFLSPPWQSSILSRSFLVDAVINFIGFIPLGAAICYWLRQSPTSLGRYAALVSVAFCLLLSLGMEIGQAWLPTRDSSLSDLALNTLGAWTGVLLLDFMLWATMGKSPTQT